MFANHGPVETGEDIEATCHALEEPDETAKLALLLLGMPARCLSPDQALGVVTKFDVDWNT